MEIHSSPSSSRHPEERLPSLPPRFSPPSPVAAIKALQLKHFLQAALGRKLDNCTIWVDSECILKQIFDTSTSFPTFVANRLSKIHKSTDISQWRYINTTSNTADFCSRGICAHESDKWARFHSGPAFLWKDESAWPVMHVSRNPILRPQGDDVFNIAATNVGPITSFTGFADIASKVGKWDKIHRLAWINRVVRRWKGYKRHLPAITASTISPHAPISSEERAEAEIILFRGIQDLHFSKEK